VFFRSKESYDISAKQGKRETCSFEPDASDAFCEDWFDSMDGSSVRWSVAQLLGADGMMTDKGGRAILVVNCLVDFGTCGEISSAILRRLALFTLNRLRTNRA